MDEKQEFYIGGRWQKSSTSNTHQVINPATELPIATIGMGGPKDVDLAVQSARKAFADYSKWNVEQRLQLLERIIAIYQRRSEELANTVTKEMGAPTWLAQVAQVASGDYHFQQTLAVLSDYGFLRKDGGTAWQREPIGVCGLITPWNWPLNQIVQNRTRIGRRLHHDIKAFRNGSTEQHFACRNNGRGWCSFRSIQFDQW